MACFPVQQGERRIQMNLTKKLVIPTVAGLLMMSGLAACDREGPMERAGEQVDKTVEKAGDKVEKSTDRRY
jgi:predicted small lipoprotein YifL